MRVCVRRFLCVGSAPLNKEHKTVLDLGAHTGQASKEFVLPGDRWILVDNQQYLQYNGWAIPQTPEGAEYLIGDIMDYHSPAEIVVCSNVLYHVPDPFALLRHLRKLTLGKLILRTYFDEGDAGWNFYGEQRPAHSHQGTAATIFYRPTLNGLRKALKEAGFEIVKEEPSGDMVTIIVK